MNISFVVKVIAGASGVKGQVVKCGSWVSWFMGRLVVIGLALVCVNAYANPIYTINEKYLGYYEYKGHITQTAVENNSVQYDDNELPKKWFLFNVGDPVYIRVSVVHFLEDINGVRPDLPGFYSLTGDVRTSNFPSLSVDSYSVFGINIQYSPDFTQENPSAHFCCSIGVSGGEDADAFWRNNFVRFNFMPTGSNELSFTAEAEGTIQFFPVPEPSSIFLFVIGLSGIGVMIFRPRVILR